MIDALEKENILDDMRSTGEDGDLSDSELASFKVIEYLLTVEIPTDTLEYMWDCLARGLVNLALASTLHELKTGGFQLPDEYRLSLQKVLSHRKLTPDEEYLLGKL